MANETCANCNGTGIVNVQMIDPDATPWTAPCGVCKGTGYLLPDEQAPVVGQLNLVEADDEFHYGTYVHTDGNTYQIKIPKDDRATS